MYTTLFTGPILTQSLQDPPTTHHVMSANGMKIVNITCIRYQKIAFDMFLDLVTVCVNCDIFNIILLQLHCLLELIYKELAVFRGKGRGLVRFAGQQFCLFLFSAYLHFFWRILYFVFVCLVVGDRFGFQYQQVDNIKAKTKKKYL